jgi:hypothetical protein
MDNRIFNIKNARSEDNQWEVISLEKIKPPIKQDDPFYSNVTVISDVKVSLLLGQYQDKNLTIEVALMPVYSEKETSIAFRFLFDGKKIESHALLKGEKEIAIPLDRNMNRLIHLVGVLPVDFDEWLKDVESLTWQ